EIMGNSSHKDFYEQRMSGILDKADLVIREGNSHEELHTFSDNTFDLIYIDALHTYGEVLQDARVAAQKCKGDGVIIFNDYIMMNHKNGVKYGIVPVANHMITEEGWKVVGFALNQQMFCDIAICRA